MSEVLKIKVISRIYGRGRGWAFTKTDFVANLARLISTGRFPALTKASKIRRVCRGSTTILTLVSYWTVS